MFLWCSRFEPDTTQCTKHVGGALRTRCTKRVAVSQQTLEVVDHGVAPKGNSRREAYLK
jgi:hypothetical protein